MAAACSKQSLRMYGQVFVIYTSSMALSIKSDAADRLARELAAVTGESLTEVVEVSLRERLARQRGRVSLSDKVRRLQRDVAELSILDHRSADEIVGYNSDGLPA